MVRHKFRWLLVKFDFELNVRSTINTKNAEKNTDATNSIINEKDIYLSIRDSISSSFGVFGTASSIGLQSTWA